ncbi:MAG: (d)CMP kinase [Candidatus Nitronauta litoralis]|uniref:Cytidylate kinase n=1 Tax=Candidatus Nitronauta litoralis TaxID=2705533 RepID=A0A7T0BV31_9BACT|nr:MAG: (d)CMP kinase [Candidatus Nitronauta litoralis]
MIIAIDGPAGSGKSTVARRIAQLLNFSYIETGSMYRAVAWKAKQLGIDANDKDRVAAVAMNLEINFEPTPEGQRLLADGEDLTGKLQNEIIGKLAAAVAANPAVRNVLVPKQQAMGRASDSVMDGRDIGTVVFPEAEKKFFLDADVKERARRRFEEIRDKHPGLTVDDVVSQVQQRDHEDRTREVSPLLQAKDAVAVDTTGKTVDQVVEEMMRHIQPVTNT